MITRILGNSELSVSPLFLGEASACERAGTPDLKFHDLQRTAVRNLQRVGVPQVVRMRMKGHRTDSMERRYNIVVVVDIQPAKELMKRPNSKS
jgi:hypothetical protein